MDETGKTIGKNIGILCRQLNVFLNRELAAYDVSASEIMYLGALSQKDGMKQDELATEFSVDKAAVARAIGSLEEKGLVIRKSVEGDKRVKEVYLTGEALKYKDVLFEIQNKWFEQVFGDTDEKACAEFSEMLENIASRSRQINEK